MWGMIMRKIGGCPLQKRNLNLQQLEEAFGSISPADTNVGLAPNGI